MPWLSGLQDGSTRTPALPALLRVRVEMVKDATWRKGAAPSERSAQSSISVDVQVYQRSLPVYSIPGDQIRAGIAITRPFTELGTPNFHSTEVFRVSTDSSAPIFDFRSRFFLNRPDTKKTVFDATDAVLTLATCGFRQNVPLFL